MTTEQKATIAKAIKAQRWARSGYEYALSAMFPYYTTWEHLKKPQLIERFYAECETKFSKIASFTTFKNINL